MNGFLKRLKIMKIFIFQAPTAVTPMNTCLHDEIHVDLYWALKNPFGSGYKDLFKNNPPMFYIYKMEKLRKKVLELYRKLNFNYIEGIRYTKNKKKVFSFTKIIVNSYLKFKIQKYVRIT